MEYQDRERFIRRISSGTFYTFVTLGGERIPIVFNEPSLSVLSESDFIYEKTYYESVEDGLLTTEESYALLREKGDYPLSMEIEAKKIVIDIKQLKESLPYLRFKKAQQKMVSETIDRGEARLSRIFKIKSQLLASTAEYRSSMAQKRFIIRKCTDYPDQYSKNKTFLDALVVCYYRDNFINAKTIRELARSDPWRIYWTISKNTGTSLFPASCVEMTETQYALVSWSKVYDFAYESENRPTDDIIEDDYKFDAWYDQECNRINRQLKKTAVDRELNIPAGSVGGQEVFIPADAEGAKEVYALNDAAGMDRIKRRKKFIREHGSVKDLQLPDVKRDVQMEMNKMSMDKGGN